MRITAAVIAVVAIASGCHALVPEVEGTPCPVRLVNHVLPVEDEGGPQEIEVELAPPYVAEMGWRYGGGPPRRPFADVRFGGPNWGRADVQWTLTDPTGAVHSGTVNIDDFRAVRWGVGLDIVGTWRYHLRALDETVDCERVIDIEVVPDSQKRAIDP